MLPPSLLDKKSNNSSPPKYHRLNAETQANWRLLETVIISQFALVAPKKVDATRFLNLAFNLRQKDQSIIEYMRKEDQLNAKCPEKFRDILGHQFILGLDDKEKVDLVQVYLRADKSTVTYTEAKQAVGKAYQRFGKPSSLDQLYDQPVFPPPTPIQSKLVALLQALKIPQLAVLPRDNTRYRSNYFNANYQAQYCCLSFYQGIYCHNCREKSHYSISCTKPIVSEEQRKANKRAIEELQDAPQPYFQRLGPELGPLLALVASAAVASSITKRKELLNK